MTEPTQLTAEELHAQAVERLTTLGPNPEGIKRWPSAYARELEEAEAAGREIPSEAGARQ